MCIDEMDWSDVIKKYDHIMDHTKEYEHVLEILHGVLQKSSAPVVEVGNNLGGSALCLLNVIKEVNKDVWLFTVDPYGAIPYSDGAEHHESVYDNERYRLAMVEISSFVYAHKLNHQHFKCTSEDFTKIWPLLNVYQDGDVKKIEKFSFVYLDGNHHPDIVKLEFEFFSKHMDDNGVIIIDDTAARQKAIQEIVHEFGWKHAHKDHRTVATR